MNFGSVDNLRPELQDRLREMPVGRLVRIPNIGIPEGGFLYKDVTEAEAEDFVNFLRELADDVEASLAV